MIGFSAIAGPTISTAGLELTDVIRDPPRRRRGSVLRELKLTATV